MWQPDKNTDLLGAAKQFAMSLDYWVINLDAREDGNPKTVSVTDMGYEVNPSSEESLFRCPECGGLHFEVMEGEFEGRPALGLVCENCETYGAVFPCGL